MPIYEYRCLKCGREFEVMQRITDPPLERCKYCSGRVERLISLTSFQLKETGWYVTDYKRRPSEDKPSEGKGKEEKSKKKED